jgi:hypothetical protein
MGKSLRVDWCSEIFRYLLGEVVVGYNRETSVEIAGVECEFIVERKTQLLTLFS